MIAPAHPVSTHSMAEAHSQLTSILNAAVRGEDGAETQLLGMVYEHPQRLAAGQMSRENPGQTLQGTALVHEAYLRLMGSPGAQWQNRAHFFGAAAEAMRRILVEHARARLRIKRGGG